MGVRGDLRAIVALALTIVVATCPPAGAAEEVGARGWEPTSSVEPKSHELLQPTAPVERSAFNATARMWYSAVSKVEAQNRSISTTQMPLYGGSVTYVPAGLGGAQFSLSAYYGVYSAGVNDFQDVKSEGHSDLGRLDIEALVQIPFGAKGGAYGAFGFRFIDFERKDIGMARDVFAIGDSFSIYQAVRLQILSGGARCGHRDLARPGGKSSVVRRCHAGWRCSQYRSRSVISRRCRSPGFCIRSWPLDLLRDFPGCSVSIRTSGTHTARS